MSRIMIQGYKCEHCGWEWCKRHVTEGDPITCPNCKTPYWDRKPKKSKKKKISK